MEESSLHVDGANASTYEMCDESDSDSASLEDDFDGNRLDPPTGIDGRLERVRSRGAQENGERSENPDNDQALDEDERASIQANVRPQAH